MKINHKKYRIHLSNSGSSRLGSLTPSDNIRHYELTNHLGNVLTVVNDRIDAATQKPEIENSVAYEPFGRPVSGLSYYKDPSNKYDFGFQRQEKAPELFGGHASWFKYRISDNRLGRFFTIDPLASKYPHNSPYAFSENRVIGAIELEGREAKIFIPMTTGYSESLRVLTDGKVPSAQVFQQAAQEDFRVARAQGFMMTAAVGGVAVAPYMPTIIPAMQSAFAVGFGARSVAGAVADVASQAATIDTYKDYNPVSTIATAVFTNPLTGQAIGNAGKITVRDIQKAWNGSPSMLLKSTIVGDGKVLDAAASTAAGYMFSVAGEQACADLTSNAAKAGIDFFMNMFQTSTTTVFSPLAPQSK